jgi:hypothetical protein
MLGLKNSWRMVLAAQLAGAALALRMSPEPCIM